MSHRDERPPGTRMCVSGLWKDKQTNHMVPEALLEVATGRGWPAMVASSFGFPKAAHQPQCTTKWLLLVKANGVVWCALAVFTHCWCWWFDAHTWHLVCHLLLMNVPARCVVVCW